MIVSVAPLLKQPIGARAGVGGAGDLHRHGDVLVRGQRRDEVKELKHEPDLLAAKPRERVFVEASDIDVIDQHGAGRGRVEPRDQAEQCGFPAA